METDLKPDLAIDRFLSRLKPLDCLIVAVSGGSDSTALLHLLHQRRAALPRLVVVTVDHGLRAAAKEEAAGVAALCDRLGIEHRIARWAGRKPRTGLQEAARLARYDLLRQCALSEGASAVVTGHTEDDQIETAIMRGERGPGRGLSGMAEAVLYRSDCWILRPLLAVRRNALRDLLAGVGIDWVEDPSNRDERFERARLRQKGTGPADADVLSMVDQAAAARRHEAVHLSGFVELHVRIHGGIVVELPQVPIEISEYLQQALGVFAALMGGRTYRPGAQQQAQIDRFTAGIGPPRINLGGSILDRRADRIFVYRERRGQSRMPLPHSQSVVWDGRYRLCNADPERDFMIAPTRGSAAPTPIWREVSAGWSDAIPPGVVTRASGAEPTLFLWSDNDIERTALTALPNSVSMQRHLALFDLFLPEFDLNLANRCAGLFGRPDYPEAPLAGPSHTTNG